MKLRVFVTLFVGLAVLLPAVGRAALPIITDQPASATNVLGQQIEFTVSADDDGNYGYQWQKNGVNIVNPDGSGSDFVKLVSTSTDGGIYSCKITNSSGAVTSAPAVLTIWYPPVITSQPQGKVVRAGSNVTFSVQVNTALVPTNFTYQWQLNGFDIFDDGIQVSGATTSVLTITNVGSDDAGDYTVEIYNDANNGATDASLIGPPVVSTNATLTVVVPPTITFQPDSLEVLEGDPVSFSVTPDPTSTDTEAFPLTYQWKKNGINLISGTNAVYDDIAAAQTNDAGNYTVVLSNWAGSVTSSNATLTVNVPVAITVQPATGVQVTFTNSAHPNLSYTNKVSLVGTEPVEYQWYFNDNPILDATNATYVFIPWSTNQSGRYRVEVDNLDGFGFDRSDDAVLTVRAEFKEPSLGVTRPTDNTEVSNSVLGTYGLATDVVDSNGIESGIASVFIQNNSGPVSNAFFYNAISNGVSSTKYFTNYASNPIILAPGTNVLSYYAMDNAGNQSVTLTRTVFYVVPIPFTLQISGVGTITSNWTGGNLLSVGRSYALTAWPAATNKFLKWSNSVTGTTTTSTNLTFLMQSNLVITAYFTETNRPTISITNPVANANLTNNGVVAVQGAAADNVQVAAVMWQLNNSAWFTANGSTNWTANVSPGYGTNVFRAYSVDNSSNYSDTNSLTFTNTSLGVLVVKTNGHGAILPNYNGSNLVFGQTYTMTASSNAGSGFIFKNWAWSTNGSQHTLTLSAAGNFVMQSNLTMQANFTDVQYPTIVVSNTLPAGALTNSIASLFGSATDNDRIAAVKFRLNSGAWMTAAGTNNWTAAVTLVAGTNIFQAYSEDPTGNVSPTSTITAVASVISPMLVTVIRTNNGEARVSFASVTGATYKLEYKNDLNTNVWNALPSPTSGTGGPLTLTDTNSPATRYYRVRADVP